MNIYTIISRLLDYPDQELVDNQELLNQVVNNELEMSSDERDGINRVLGWMKDRDLMALEREYVDTFDMQAHNSLHLTHHLFGEERGRGPALVDLGEHFKGEGLEPKSGELPDFLPLILEYVATLDEVGARFFLADAAKVTSVLAANLEEAESPYAPLLRIIENRGQLAQSAA